MERTLQQVAREVTQEYLRVKEETLTKFLTQKFDAPIGDIYAEAERGEFVQCGQTETFFFDGEPIFSMQVQDCKVVLMVATHLKGMR